MRSEFWQVDPRGNPFLAVGNLMDVSSQVHAYQCGTIQVQIGPAYIDLTEQAAEELSIILSRAVEAVRTDRRQREKDPKA